MAATVTAADWRGTADHALRDARPLYASWRADGPVVHVPELGGWVVTDAALAAAVMRDWETWSSDRFEGPLPAAHGGWLRELAAEDPAVARLLTVPLQTLVALDPPDHTRLRRVLAPAFSASGIRRLEPLVRAQVQDLVAPLVTGEVVDFVGACAEPLPFRIVATLFGSPEAEWDQFAQLAAAANGDNPHRETKAQLRRRLRAEVQLMTYFARRVGGDGLDPEGLLAALGAAVDRGDITLREATGACREVLVAGADSTGNLLAGGVLRLAQDADAYAELRRRPAAVEAFVEEILRLDPPFKGFWRRATRATILAGRAIPQDGLVLLCYPALNRDPAAHERPDDLDLGRPSPRRHLSFGHGIHFCLGAPLARLQGTATFEALVARAARVELAVPAAELRHRPSVQIAGVERLPVRLCPAGGSGSRGADPR